MVTSEFLLLHIAARGIDINKLRYVVNYDIPNESETYVHRVDVVDVEKKE